jgi:hypothetical protein
MFVLERQVFLASNLGVFPQDPLDSLGSLWKVRLLGRAIRYILPNSCLFMYHEACYSDRRIELDRSSSGMVLFHREFSLENLD